ncbi:MAG: PEP-CTERM sorting domain-containing protein [Planctomycetia bacterium]|nr:PEP-CTERM sorting domain-containing protein [Planctomycetia bacterium]
MVNRVGVGILALMVVAWLVVPAIADIIIYSDTFNTNNSVLLDGTAPEVRSGTLGGSSTANWRANTLTPEPWTRLGGYAQLAWGADTATQASAWLPFTPQNGLVYTYSFDFQKLRSCGNTQNWLAAGFLNSPDDPGLPWFNYASGPGVAERRDYSNLGWTYLDAGNAGNVDIPPGTLPGGNKQPVHFTIVLDTSNAAWTASFTVTDADGTYTRGPVAYATNPTITALGFGNGGAGGIVNNFQLTGLAVPEPSTLALLASGLLGLLAYAWRKRR